MRTAHALASLAFVAAVYGAVFAVHADDAVALGLSAFGALVSFHAVRALG